MQSKSLETWEIFVTPHATTLASRLFLFLQIPPSAHPGAGRDPACGSHRNSAVTRMAAGVWIAPSPLTVIQSVGLPGSRIKSGMTKQRFFRAPYHHGICSPHNSLSPDAERRKCTRYLAIRTAMRGRLQRRRITEAPGRLSHGGLPEPFGGELQAVPKGRCGVDPFVTLRPVRPKG